MSSLNTLTVVQLKALAKEKKLKGYSTLKKAELLELLGNSSNTEEKKEPSLCATIEKMSRAPEYKFRAETMHDVLEWLRVYQNMSSITITRDLLFPDVDVSFSSKDDIQTIRDSMKKVIDSHVMQQSLNYAGVYTGDRWYDEE